MAKGKRERPVGDDRRSRCQEGEDLGITSCPAEAEQLCSRDPGNLSGREPGGQESAASETGGLT